MYKDMKKFIIAIIILFVLNVMLSNIGLSPFGLRFFFPYYYDTISYQAVNWLDGEHILFTKRVANWKQETRFLFFEGGRGIISNSYLCSMKYDGSENRELLEIPEGFYKIGAVSFGNKTIVLSGEVKDKYSNTVKKIARVALDGKGFLIIGDGSGVFQRV